MQVFMVGGAVRDALLGRPVQDHDWVVVGATPEQMQTLGFKQVGRDFPVFLHPHTGEEFALARTERKTGRGYAGFSVHAAPDVTLEQDLLRRDLTINAIAQDDHGKLIDPYGGVRDIERRVLRHVGPAFAEDPLRVLRVARFAARFAGFTIAAETMALMRDMVASGELDELVAERRWQELARGLMEATPSRMLETLRECGALKCVLPEIAEALDDQSRADPILARLDRCADTGQALSVRWACLLADTLPCPHQAPCDTAALARKLCDRLKTPNDCRDLAVLLTRERQHLLEAPSHGANAVMDLLVRCDALRRPGRFETLLDCLGGTTPGDMNPTRTGADLKTFWLGLLEAARTVDAGEIAGQTLDRSNIPARVFAARCEAVQAVLESQGLPGQSQQA